MKTITIRHSTNMELPKSVRSYIDSHSDEFKDLDIWTKIAQIAYRIKRGAGAELFMDIKDEFKFKVLVTATFMPWVFYFFNRDG